MAFEPSTETEKIAHAEVIQSLGELDANHGLRVQAVHVALPGVLWAVVLIGAVVNTGITYFFWVDNIRAARAAGGRVFIRAGHAHLSDGRHG